MIEAVFISDLHLHPDDTHILTRFKHFICWAKKSVKNVYILGDFFHVWAGDDSINAWSLDIARQLNQLSSHGVSVYFMHGNRDFLLGSQFASLAGWNCITEPSIINLGHQKTLLAHGDGYCTQDKAHQRFRHLTRNFWFKRIFLKLPLRYREKLVNKVRTISQNGTKKTIPEMDVVPESFFSQLSAYNATVLIHGHTHQPGMFHHANNDKKIIRYVLSDWDDNPKILCYDSSIGYYFKQFNFFEEIGDVT